MNLVKALWRNRFVRRITFIFLDSAMAAPVGNLLDVAMWKAMLIAGGLGVYHFVRKAIADARAKEESGTNDDEPQPTETDDDPGDYDIRKGRESDYRD